MLGLGEPNNTFCNKLLPDAIFRRNIISERQWEEDKLNDVKIFRLFFVLQAEVLFQILHFLSLKKGSSSSLHIQPFYNLIRINRICRICRVLITGNLNWVKISFWRLRTFSGSVLLMWLITDSGSSRCILEFYIRNLTFVVFFCNGIISRVIDFFNGHHCSIVVA